MSEIQSLPLRGSNTRGFGPEAPPWSLKGALTYTGTITVPTRNNKGNAKNEMSKLLGFQRRCPHLEGSCSSLDGKKKFQMLWTIEATVQLFNLNVQDEIITSQEQTMFLMT